MKSTPLQTTMRDLRVFMARPRLLIGLAGVAVLLTVAQPFGFRVPGATGLSLIYWSLIVGVCFPMGFFFSSWTELSQKHWPRALSIAVAALAMGVCVTIWVYLMNMVFLGWPLFSAEFWWAIVVTTVPTAILVTILIRLAMGHDTAETADPKAPALLARLPFEKRGAILHLAAQDHYTQVTTAKGQELVLIRFADAVTEAEPTKGIQTHRSHWVAIGAVKSVTRQGDGALVSLTNGDTAPVSRSQMSTIKDAGFL